jgi:hypothetical protein
MFFLPNYHTLSLMTTCLEKFTYRSDQKLQGIQVCCITITTLFVYVYYSCLPCSARPPYWTCTQVHTHTHTHTHILQESGSHVSIVLYWISSPKKNSKYIVLNVHQATGCSPCVSGGWQGKMLHRLSIGSQAMAPKKINLGKEIRN